MRHWDFQPLKKYAFPCVSSLRRLIWAESEISGLWFLPNNFFLAEKRWGLLLEFVENCGINSWLVLFIWNGYNIEVHNSLPSSILYIYIISIIFHGKFKLLYSYLNLLHGHSLFINMHFTMIHSLQRRYKLSPGWMAKPIWKQVSFQIILLWINHLKMISGAWYN